MARTRFVGSGREKEGGLLAVHKRDFEAHRTGGDWRHKADHIDMNPQLARFPSPTVQGTLEDIATFLDGGVSSFISIGDGFARGDFNVGDPGIPTLEAAFTAAFASTRLQNGGTILLKPGNFEVSSTIIVPRGISIMGDLAGTYINNPATNAPIFRISRAQNYYNIGDYPIPNLENAQPTDVNRIFNLILTDNWENGSGTGATVAMRTSPMISCDKGSNVEIDRVTFLGRTDDSGTIISTYRGIQTTAGLNPGTATILKVRNCYFDGVKSAIEFGGEEGIKDHLRVEKCRLRTYGIAPGSNEDTAAISFNLCNAHIVNNHHLGNNDVAKFSTFIFALIRAFAPVSNDIQVVVMGNSGGLTTAGTIYDRYLLLDSRAAKTAYKGTITGNSWGIKWNNDWYMTVGDGTNSLGDINGTNAVDVALTRSRQAGEGSYIIVNSGTYTVTATGSSTQRAKLIGNPRDTKPTLNIDGSSTAGRPGHDGINIGMELSNFTLNAVGSRQTIKMYPGGISDNRWRVENCEFNNVTLTVEQVSDVDYASVEVEGCEFNQTGAYANTVSLLLSEATRFISIRDCYFRSTGYALYIGDVSSAAAAFQRINIERCRFEGAALSGNKSIDANSPLGASYNYYIYVANGNRNSDVTFRDTTVQLVKDTDAAYTFEPLDATITNKLIYVVCGTVTVDNCKVFGPYQTYVDSGTWALPTWYILAERGVQFLNSRFFGSLPVKISEESVALNNPQYVRTEFDDGAWLRIDGCEFSGYDNINVPIGLTFFCPTNLAVELEPYAGDTSKSYGIAMIHNSSFFATRDGLTGASSEPIPAQNKQYTGSGYHAIGCAQIYGEGWTVHFSNNDVNCILGNASSGYDQAGVVIDTVCTATKDLADSNAILTGNRLAMNSTYPAGVTGEYTNCISIRSQFASVTGNSFRMEKDAIGLGSRHFYRISADSGNDLGATVTGNVFNYIGTPADSAMFSWGAGTKGIMADNAFDTTVPNMIQPSGSGDWVFERNKGQQGSCKVRIFSGLLSDGNVIYQPTTLPTKWADIDSIKIGTYDVAEATTKYNVSVKVNVPLSAENFDWRVPLFDVLPTGAKVVSASITADVTNGADWTSLSMTLYIRKPSGSSTDTLLGSDTEDIKASAPTAATATVTLSSSEPVVNRPFAHVSFSLNPTGSARTCYISALTVVYEW